MAVAAKIRRVVVVLGMFELLAEGQLLKLFAFALGDDGVAGIAVVGFDAESAIAGDVLAVVTTETALPIFVTDVVGIGAPIGFHVGKEIIGVNFLDGIDGGAHAGFVAEFRQ